MSCINKVDDDDDVHVIPLLASGHNGHLVQQLSCCKKLRYQDVEVPTFVA